MKRALGLFVEFEPGNEPANSQDQSPLSQKFPLTNFQSTTNTPSAISGADLDKFEQHFTGLFEKSNLPGPDYFEFWKMMEALQKHLPDENARIPVVFATLSVQGLTKESLITSAAKYKLIIEEDKAAFDKAAGAKESDEVEKRRNEMQALQQKIADNSTLIQQLTQEITAAQQQASELKKEVEDQEEKILNSRRGYQVASEAMIRKINNDIQKFESSL
ncbi:hypothetical protein ACE38W_20105 [Chitinophaga sp. Hz27]|uniref:hypothetical protein n=1 Tax=Chitinophaga sp. Hz27 TaxID=3347169 RepID=UPI0035D5C388